MNIDPNKDYYAILGVGKTASKDEIHRSYLKKSKENHPDLHPDDKDATRKFQEIQEANEVLSDQSSRRQYDLMREGGGGWGEYRDGRRGFSNFEEAMFRQAAHMGGMGGMGGFGGFSEPPKRPKPNIDTTPQKGERIRIEVRLPFEEFMFGCTHEFEIKVNRKCQHCKGGTTTGKFVFGECPHCKGRGILMQSPRSGFIVQETCPYCGGLGYGLKDLCPVCRGSGVNGKRTQTLELEIPKFTLDGYARTFEGYGHCGSFGGESGDIEIKASIDFNGKFYMKDTMYGERSPLYTDHPISLFKALTGGTERVMTPYGEVDVEIPPNTKNGEIITVPEKGMYLSSDLKRIGDLRVVIHVDEPTGLSKKYLKSLRELNERIEKDNLSAFRKVFDTRESNKAYRELYEKNYGSMMSKSNKNDKNN